MTPTTRGWIIGLAVLDAVLVVVLLVLLLVGAAPDDDAAGQEEASDASSSVSGGGASPDPGAPTEASTTPPPTTEPEPEPELAPPPEGAVELAAFTLPSRNIACGLDDGGVTCTIADAAYTPPPGEACEGRGQIVQLGDDGVALPCPVEPAQAAAEDVPVLEYGQAATLGSWACTSSERGVECFSLADGTGFTLARAAFTSYGPGRLG